MPDGDAPRECVALAVPVIVGVPDGGAGEPVGMPVPLAVAVGVLVPLAVAVGVSLALGGTALGESDAVGVAVPAGRSIRVRDTLRFRALVPEGHDLQRTTQAKAVTVPAPAAGAVQSADAV